MSWVAGLVGLAMEDMEQASKKTSKHWSKCVCIQIVVQEVSFSSQHNLIGGQCYAYSRVETRSKLVGARSAAHKSHYDANSRANTFTIASCVLSFDHQDNADEEESAHNLVDDNVEVH